MISAIKVLRIENSETKLKGIASITLNDMIAIHDIKILINNHTAFIAMPSKKTKPGTFKDVVHPINAEVRNVFENLIFSVYNYAETHCLPWVEVRIKEENHKNFYELGFDAFYIARVGEAIETNSNNKQVKLQEKNKQGNIDDELLKWLES